MNGVAPSIRRPHPPSPQVSVTRPLWQHIQHLCIDKEEGWGGDFSHHVSIYKDRKRKNTKLSTR